jgi:hypothetical protein
MQALADQRVALEIQAKHRQGCVTRSQEVRLEMLGRLEVLGTEVLPVKGAKVEVELVAALVEVVEMVGAKVSQGLPVQHLLEQEAMVVKEAAALELQMMGLRECSRFIRKVGRFALPILPVVLWAEEEIQVITLFQLKTTLIVQVPL